jgi:hypothetical protein
MNEIMHPRLANGNEDRNLVYNPYTHKNQNFYRKDTLRTEWKLVGESFVPDIGSEKDKEGKYTEGSIDKNYIQQTRLLRDYLKSIDSLTPEEEAQCSDAHLMHLTDTIGMDWKTGLVTDWAKLEANCQKVNLDLSQLLININHRRKAIEIIYDLALQFNKYDHNIFMFNKYDWSRSLNDDGRLVYVGGIDRFGASIESALSGEVRDGVGVVSVR